MKLFVTTITLLCLGFTVYDAENRADRSGHINTKSQLALTLSAFESQVEIDKIRQQTVGKIVRIINRFNPGLKSEVKRDIAHEIYEMSLKYENLDVNLLCATITHESGLQWEPTVVSKAGAMGLMQIMPRTGKMLAEIEGIEWTSAREVLFDPIKNIRMGSRYLSSLIDVYELEGGLAAYNGGIARVELWLRQNKAESVLWPETRAYIPFVLNLYDQYQKLEL